MKPLLSIIIPCYNCEKTLQEAVESLYKQDLTDFEIVMVDDGSTDSTQELMKNLSKKHSEIKIIFHEKNKGGGATRNTAVSNSHGEIIFCLDSDDILPENVLGRMVAFLYTKKCDGVVFEATHFFENTDTKRVEIIRNSITDQEVQFSDLFKSGAGFLTKVNFLYTKKLFDLTGGYPEDHGFDTQTFGYKSLLNGGKIYICPNTFYFHRRDSKNASYFMREYAEGKLSYNTYLMLEDMIYIFSDKIIDEILHFNIINQSTLGQVNLPSFLEELFKENGADKFFVPDYNNFLKPNSFNSYIQEFSGNRNSIVKNFINSVYATKKQMYDESLSKLSTLTQEDSSLRILYVNMIRCILYKTSMEKRMVNEMSFKAFVHKNETAPFIRLLYKLRNKLRNKLKKIWTN